LATILNDKQETIECAKHSKLKNEIEYEEIQEHLEIKLTSKELKELEKEQKRKIIKTEHGYRYGKEKSLKKHFKDCKTRMKRNRAILTAIEDDYKQVEVARYLGINDSTVSKIFLTLNEKGGNS